MYPPIINPQLMRFEQMFQNMQQSAPQQLQQPGVLPNQGGFEGMNVQMPERLGATGQMGELPQVIDPSQIGSEAISQSPEQNIARRLQELYSPETAANERLTALLSQYPQRDNPGVLAKIVGSLIGGARGPDAADRAMYGGYYRKLEDWENQVKPAYQAANQERYNNSNERQYANQVLNQELNREKFDHKQDYDTKALQLRERGVKVREYKAKNPNATFKVDQATGFIIAIDPVTKQVSYPTYNGERVLGRDLSFEDRQDILQENRIESIDRMAEVGLNRVEASGKESRTTKSSPDYDDLNPGNTNDLTESAKRTAKQSRAEDFKSRYPDLADWIETEGTDITVRQGKTGGWFSDAESTELRKAIVDHIVDGKPFVMPKANAKPGAETTKGQPDQTINPNNTQLPKGRIWVTSPNKETKKSDGTVIPPNTKMHIPMERLDAYIVGGWKKAN